MELFNDQAEHPLVLNFTQKMEFAQNFLIGQYVDQETKTRNGETRTIVEWYPTDAVDKEESDNLQRTEVYPDNLLTWGQGEISPRKIYVMLPDGYSELPDMVKSDAPGDSVASLGRFFAQFHYQYRAVLEALEVVAENEPEVMEKVRFATRNSELDDAMTEKAREFFEMVDEFSENQSSNSSSNSD